MRIRRQITLMLTLALFGAAPVVTAAPRSKAEARDTTDTVLQAAEAAKLSVADAIAVAEKHSEGGTVLAVRFTVQGFRPTYFLRTYQNGEVWEGQSTPTRARCSTPEIPPRKAILTTRNGRNSSISGQPPRSLPRP